MKSICYLLILLSAISFAQSENEHWTGEAVQVGKTYYTFANDLTLRDAPAKNGAKLSLLAINTAVTILEISENRVQVNGLDSPWVKIQTGKQQGYVASALLALGRFRLNDGSFLLYTRKGSGNDDPYNTKALFRHVSTVGFKEFNQVQLYNQSFAVKVFNNRGLQGIDHVIAINYLAEACGEEGGVSYYTLNLAQGQWVPLGFFSSTGDGGIYHQYEQLIFPADEYGVQDTLIYNGEEGMCKDPDGLEYRTVKKSRNYEWRNGALVTPIVLFVYE